MKSKLHPKYYKDTKVTCACGNSFTTGSTLPEIEVEICSNCHPFYTGEMRLVDTQGRIEKFQARQKKASSIGKIARKKEKIKKAKARPSSLKEMLQTDSKSEKKSPKKN